jgi:2-amino-4-hydroxy-6-hydroxymethyldihydropteridine diphosphokinase
MSATRQAFISAGSNLGNRAETLRAAMEVLARAPGIARAESSPLYETAPVDVLDQPAFLNLAAGIETTLSPERLLARLLAIEADFGRARDSSRPRGPRTLDLDLLLYEGETRAGTDAGTTLILPHPRMWQRAFVLVPLRELVETRAGWMRGEAWAETHKQLDALVRDPAIAAQRITKDEGLWTMDEGRLRTTARLQNHHGATAPIRP